MIVNLPKVGYLRTQVGATTDRPFSLIQSNTITTTFGIVLADWCEGPLTTVTVVPELPHFAS